MSDILRLANELHTRWDRALRPVHLQEARHCGRYSSVKAYDDSILRLAFNVLTEQRVTQKNLVGALLAETSNHPRILNTYIKMLRGESAATAAHILPSSEILLPTPAGNFLIGPYSTTYGIKDVKAVILTTPSRAESLPRLAEFTDRAYIGDEHHTFERVWQIGGLCFEFTEFTCKVSFGETILGKVDLLDVYENAVNAIDDAPSYMRAWDIYIEDHLRRVKHTIGVVGNLLQLERQSQQDQSSQEPSIKNMDIFKRVLAPLVRATEIARQAFCRSLMSVTLEGKVIDAQIGSLNNAMTRSKAVIDTNFPRMLTQANVEAAIKALRSLFDLPYHINATYRDNPILGNTEIHVVSPRGRPFIVEDPIAIRRIIDEIVYRAIMNQDDKPQNLTFDFDHARSEIDVSYSIPQPPKVASFIKKVATRFTFLGDIDFRHSPEGIAGLSIKDKSQGRSFGSGQGPISSSSHNSPLSGVQTFTNVAAPPNMLGTILNSAMLCVKI